MSNEQKMREAIKRLLKAHRITVQAPPKTITEAENQLREIENAVKYAEEALATTAPVMANGLTEAETDASASVVGLATTEQEPTGMPELPEPDEMGDRWLSSHVYTEDQMQTYGEQCWKAGYKHGAWGDKPAVNQQLTTEPFDEREAFEKVFPTPSHCQRCGDGYAATSYNAWEAHNHIERWKGWQARAAMAEGANQ